jgi:hypothetical protein
VLNYHEIIRGGEPPFAVEFTARFKGVESSEPLYPKVLVGYGNGWLF